MLRKLWKDEAGTVALEYLLVATIASLALVVGLNAVGRALNTELTELARAIGNIDQTYSYAGYSTCKANANGGNVSDADIIITTGDPANAVTDISQVFCSP